MRKRRGITIKHESGDQTFIRSGTELSYIANLLSRHNDQQADFFNHHGKMLFRELLTIKRKCTVFTLLLTAFIVLNAIMFFVLFQTHQHLPNSVHTDSTKESFASFQPENCSCPKSSYLLISPPHGIITARRKATMPPKSPPDITVFDIADWFLARAKAEDKPLKHIKLQRLVYFAYGWYCAYYDTPPLFGETIYAWRRGVGVKELHEKYGHCGDNPIIPEGLKCPNLDENVEEILESVWKAYVHLSESLLGRAIYRHSAWRKTQRSFEWEAVMSPEAIQETFKELVEKYDNVEA